MPASPPRGIPPLWEVQRPSSGVVGCRGWMLVSHREALQDAVAPHCPLRADSAVHPLKSSHKLSLVPRDILEGAPLSRWETHNF